MNTWQGRACMHHTDSPQANHDRRRRWSVEEISVADTSRLQRAVAGTAIGNFMEWYDFGVYGFLAATIARVFFSSQQSSVQLISTFATLAAAFLVRPLGGVVFGPLGDRIGRKQVLAVTILLMALGTTVTGLLPDYRTAGIWAPLLLLVTRLIQGFSTGGEYVGAMTYISEHSPDRRRGWLAGWLPFGTLTGYIVGAGLVTGLTAVLSEEELLAWGWRIPFLVGAPLAAVGLYMRMRMEETPAFDGLEAGDRAGGKSGMQQLRATVIDQWRPLLVCAGLVLTFNVTNYMLTGYLPAYLSEVLGVADTPALMMVVITLAVLLVAVTFVARLSDRIGRKPIMWTGAALLVVASVPAFLMMQSANGYGVIFIGVMLLGAMLLCFNSTEPSTLPALFPTNVRYGALAIGFNLSVAAFGGTTPLIAEALVSTTGDPLMPAYYLMVAGVIGLVSIAFLPEPARRRLPGSAPIVADEREAREIADTRAT